MALHRFLHALANPGQNPGPYPIKAPSQPVRGFDAPQRDALYLPIGPGAPVNGAGQICGNYMRQAPAFFNVHPAAVVADVSGAGLSAGGVKKAGPLVALESLFNFTGSKG